MRRAAWRTAGVAAISIAMASATGCGAPSGIRAVASNRSASEPAAPSPPTPSFALDETWNTLLVEEFDAPLDDDRWNTCHWWTEGDGCRIASSNELQWYLPEQVDVRDGVLVLTADRRPEQEHPVVSGMLQSGPRGQSARPKFAFLYGAVEARVQLPAGAGLWPAFWMLPTSTSSRPEIDILELYGQEPDVMRMHLHWQGADGEPQQRGEYADGVDLTRGWHTVGVRWEPGIVIWYRDGEEQWRVERDEVPSEPMYLVLNLAVGGDQIGPPGDDVVFPAEMRVDWVRVWQRATR